LFDNSGLRRVLSDYQPDQHGMQPTRCASLRVRLMHEPLALSNHDMQESGGIEHDQSRGTGEGSNLLNSRGISQVSSVVPGARLGTMGLADRGGLQSQETRLPDPGSVRGQTAGEAARAMRHRTTPRFWERYQNLPETVPDLADKNFQLLQRDPRHPSLQFKKVGNLWSVRVGGASSPGGRRRGGFSVGVDWDPR